MSDLIPAVLSGEEFDADVGCGRCLVHMGFFRGVAIGWCIERSAAYPLFAALGSGAVALIGVDSRSLGIVESNV